MALPDSPNYAAISRGDDDAVLDAIRTLWLLVMEQRKVIQKLTIDATASGTGSFIVTSGP